MTVKLVLSAAVAAMAISIAALGSAPIAEIEVFTDRAAWEAELNESPDGEDFEAEIPGNYITPYLTANGVLLDSMGGP
jgi:hypothetical protein